MISLLTKIFNIFINISQVYIPKCLTDVRPSYIRVGNGSVTNILWTNSFPISGNIIR